MHVLNLNAYFNKLVNINYALTKIDVPYNPKNFPYEYAIGKDLDIFVCSEDFMKIKNITKEFFIQYHIFNIQIIEKDNNFRLRLEQNNKLHFLIDIIINNELIQNKEKKNNYYILSLENEKKVRIFEYNKNSHKKYHKEWLINHNFLKKSNVYKFFG